MTQYSQNLASNIHVPIAVCLSVDRPPNLHMPAPCLSILIFIVEWETVVSLTVTDRKNTKIEQKKAS